MHAGQEIPKTQRRQEYLFRATRMKLIIAGSREAQYRPFLIDEALEASGFSDITEIVSGAARGVDLWGEIWGELRGLAVRRFPADWAHHGRCAGPIRNGQMAEYADALLAIWDGKSKGTADMIQQMRRLGKPVFVFSVESAPLVDRVAVEFKPKARTAGGRIPLTATAGNPDPQSQTHSTGTGSSTKSPER
jgi:hypothetical protein